MRVIVLVFMLLVSNRIVSAQDSLKSIKSISFSQGFTRTVNKDLYRSPYVYRGFNPSMSLMFESVARKSIHRVYSEFIFGTLKTSFSPLASTNQLTLQYAYLRNIISNKKYNLYLGPQVAGFSWRTDYFPDMVAPDYGRVHSYLLGFSLDLALRMEYKISPKSTLKVYASVPLCSYIDRPHFLDGSDRQAQFNVLNYWNPQVKLTYEYAISRKVSFLINYQYNYLHYGEPKDIRMLNSGLSVGLKIKF